MYPLCLHSVGILGSYVPVDFLRSHERTYIFFKVTFHFLWFYSFSLFYLNLTFIFTFYILLNVFSQFDLFSSILNNVSNINFVTRTLVMHAVTDIERHQLIEFIPMSSLRGQGVHTMQPRIVFLKLEHIPNMNRSKHTLFIMSNYYQRNNLKCS